MYKRWDSSTKRAMAAINAGTTGKKQKDDPTLENPMNTKAFQGSVTKKYDKASVMNEFRYDQKASTDSYKMTRTFFGIKNPWVGTKIYEPTAANIESKGQMANLDRKVVEDKKAKVGSFYQADKKATKQEELLIKTPTFIPIAETPGASKQASEKLGKEMSIDQVRDLLNKEKKTSASASF